MRLFLDTNILYLFLRPPKGAPALRTWLGERKQRLARADDEAVTSPLVFDELAYRLVLARMTDQGQRDVLSLLRADPAGALRQHAPEIAALLERLMVLPGLSVAAMNAQTLGSALRIMVRYGLLPRDACHVAVAEAARCDAILSLDPDFQRSTELIGWLGPP